MKRSRKIIFTLSLTFLLFLLLELTSCFEYKGGDIWVENRRNEQISVDITDTDFYPLFSDRNIPSNSSGQFSFSDNGTYWVRVYENHTRTPYKSVYVSGKENFYIFVD